MDRHAGKRDRTRKKRRGDENTVLAHEWTKIRSSAGTASIAPLDAAITPVDIGVQMDDETVRPKVSVVRVNAVEKPEKHGNPTIKSTTEQETPEMKVPKSKRNVTGVHVAKLSKDEAKGLQRSSEAERTISRTSHE